MLTKCFAKVVGVLLLCLALSATASAQYGGGGGGMGGSGGSNGTGNTNGYGSGSGKAIGIGVGVAAAAVVGVVLLVHHKHATAPSQASLIGCTTHDLHGISLLNEKDNQTYTIIPGSSLVQPGDRVELKGVVSDEGSGTPTFQVQYLVKNYGACGPLSAGTAKPATDNVLVTQASN